MKKRIRTKAELIGFYHANNAKGVAYSEYPVQAALLLGQLSSLQLVSVAAHTGYSLKWSENLKVRFSCDGAQTF